MTSKSIKSNFDDRQVVSKPKSGVRVIRLKLSTKAKESLSSKSPGIRSSNRDVVNRAKDDDSEVEEGHALAAC